jgi:hypothetical protein
VERLARAGSAHGLGADVVLGRGRKAAVAEGGGHRVLVVPLSVASLACRPRIECDTTTGTSAAWQSAFTLRRRASRRLLSSL